MALNILGISAYYHDSAAAVIRDGEIIAAAQEERFTRIKHDRNFPNNAVAYCLREARIFAKELDHVVFYDKPLLHLDRMMETFLAFAPQGFKQFYTAMPVWMHEKLHLPGKIDEALGNEYPGQILFSVHHLSHAASAFYPSPYERAAILTMDGVGEWSTATLGVGNANKVKLLKEIRFPHSLGLLYSAFTYYLGFRVNSGEYKVMGLAPYGEPKYYKQIMEHLIDVKQDGSFYMDMRYFNYCQGLTMTSSAFHDLFGGEPRKPEAEMTQRHMDLAASVQKATNEIVLKLAQQHAKETTGEENLCLAGGVALNCVANGLILKEKIFKNIFVQPAAGDAGCSLGGALLAYHQLLDKPRIAKKPDAMLGSFLGPAYSRKEILAALEPSGVRYRELKSDELADSLCDFLEQGQIIGLLQGRMEFGPRALGGRSIIGDPRNPEMQTKMNLKIKFRESFRPFAPAVLEEDTTQYFDLDGTSPYMLLVAPVKEERRKPTQAASAQGMELLKQLRSDIPAVTHIDYSARVQTVSKMQNPFFYRLLVAWKKKTGCSVLVNTSFNIRGEPIVCTPVDALKCFLHTDMDVLVLENFVLLKKEQKEVKGREQYLKQFVPD